MQRDITGREAGSLLHCQNQPEVLHRYLMPFLLSPQCLMDEYRGQMSGKPADSMHSSIRNSMGLLYTVHQLQTDLQSILLIARTCSLHKFCLALGPKVQALGHTADAPCSIMAFMYE